MPLYALQQMNGHCPWKQERRNAILEWPDCLKTWNLKTYLALRCEFARMSSSISKVSSTYLFSFSSFVATNALVSLLLYKWTCSSDSQCVNQVFHSCAGQWEVNIKWSLSNEFGPSDFFSPLTWNFCLN